ncbi:MAG: hypothetical protein ACRDJY_10855 [Thermoleophilaceae bacterium]
MKLLFVFQDPGRIRFFEDVLALLAARGHSLHVVVESYRERLPGQLAFIEALARSENVTVEPGRKRPRSGWTVLARQLRLSLDFLHYLNSCFDDAPDFRRRAADAAPRGVVAVARVRPLRGLVRSVLAGVERALPVTPDVDEVLDRVAPDIVAVTPYLWFGAPQTDWVRGAKRRGIHSAALMFSWDNLTSKGSIRELPERLTVWNEVQREEAANVHGVPRERTVATGAQNWDHWFDWEPSISREEFCAKVGLDPARPYILWLESSGYVGGEERFISEWIDRLRHKGGERLRTAGILVRPHPQMTADHWEGAGLDAIENVSVFPAAGEVPLDDRSRTDFYDSLHHSALVAGVNTSAFIESAILGRPCLTLELERFRKGQTSTLHFHHLLAENGGPLQRASSWEEHLAQLEAALADPAPAADRDRRFVERFVRPFGRSEAATPRVADAIEQLALSRAPRPARDRRVLRAAVAPIARRAARAA